MFGGARRDGMANLHGDPFGGLTAGIVALLAQDAGQPGDQAR